MERLPRIIVGAVTAIASLASSAALAQNLTTKDNPLISRHVTAAVGPQLETAGAATSTDEDRRSYLTLRSKTPNHMIDSSFGWDQRGLWGPSAWGRRSGFGWTGWAGWSGTGPLYQGQTTVGSLTLDFEHASKGTLIWRGPFAERTRRFGPGRHSWSDAQRAHR